jgi:hypothetical protein
MSGDRERFLALFGMDRERSVGEAESVGLIDHLHDATHRFDVSDRKWCCHRDDEPHRWGRVGRYEQTGAAVRLPLAYRLGRRVERRLPAAEVYRPSIESIPLWHNIR